MERNIGTQVSHSRMIYLLVAVSLLLMLTGNGCELAAQQGLALPAQEEAPQTLAQQVTGGPRAWIEFPPDGGTLPMAPIILVAYAADAANIGMIDLRMNGEMLPEGPVGAIGQNSASTLVRRDHLWTPEKEGEYVLEARARGGDYGEPAYIKFCIVSCQPAPETLVGEAATATHTPTPSTGTPSPQSPTPSITPTPSKSPEPEQVVQMEFSAVPPYVFAGACAQLSWSVQGAASVELDGELVANQGSRQVCLCNRTTYRLIAYKANGTSLYNDVTVDVYGSCEVESPTEEIPVIIPTQPGIEIMPTQPYFVPLQTSTSSVPEAFPTYP